MQRCRVRGAGINGHRKLAAASDIYQRLDKIKTPDTSWQADR